MNPMHLTHREHMLRLNLSHKKNENAIKIKAYDTNQVSPFNTVLVRKPTQAKTLKPTRHHVSACEPSNDTIRAFSVDRRQHPDPHVLRPKIEQFITQQVPPSSPNKSPKKTPYINLLCERENHKHHSKGAKLFSSTQYNSIADIMSPFKKISIHRPVMNFKNVSDRFITLKFLGKGKCSDVFQAIDRYSQQIVAIKIIQKTIIQKYNLSKLMANEIKIQSFLQHPNILKLYGVVSDDKQVALILEYCESDLYRSMKSIRENDEFMRMSIYQIGNAIEFLHKSHVLHRDIKPENVMILNKQMKLADFGLAMHLKHKQQLSEYCGTIGYMAPEIRKQESYDYKADAYSYGMVIRECNDSAQDLEELAYSLCIEDPKQRMSIVQAMQSTALAKQKGSLFNNLSMPK